MKKLTRLLLGQSRLERVIEDRCLHEPMLQYPPYSVDPRAIADELDNENSLKKEYKRTKRMFTSVVEYESIISSLLFLAPFLGGILACEIGRNIYESPQSVKGINLGLSLSLWMGLSMPVVYQLLNGSANWRNSQRDKKVNEQHYESQ